MGTLISQSQSTWPHIYVCSRHPLVLQVLARIASRHASIEGQGDIPDIDVVPVKRGCHILLLDTCSLNRWLPAASHWQETEGPVIALVPHLHGGIAELHAIYMKIQGVVTVSPDLERDLAEAIGAVTNGRVWMRPDTMTEYTQRSFEASKNVLITSLTQREKQIVKLIQEEFSNKQIAVALNISERTVKFHVSNILQKYNIRNRSSLFLMRPQKLAEEESKRVSKTASASG